MSPRAACRLEHLGFDPVYDYAAGKVDWMAAGLPTERAEVSELRALDATDPNPPTCRTDTPLAAVPFGDEGQAVIVVNDHGIVLGRIRPDVTATASALAVEVMESGPATVRAHEPLAPLLERMTRRNVKEIIVTTPEGRLMGVVRRHPHPL